MNRINHVTVKLVKEKSALYESNVVRSPEDGAKVFQQYLEGADREHFVVACLDTKNKIVNVTTAHIGSLNASVVHPREVFKTAILSNAASIIVCHNHPSGNVTPSSEDVQVTGRLIEAGKVIGIEVLDHIIIGDDDYLSLKEKGYI